MFLVHVNRPACLSDFCLSAYPDQWGLGLTPACHTPSSGHGLEFSLCSDDLLCASFDGAGAGCFIQAGLKLSILQPQHPECRLGLKTWASKAFPRFLSSQSSIPIGLNLDSVTKTLPLSPSPAQHYTKTSTAHSSSKVVE